MRSLNWWPTCGCLKMEGGLSLPWKLIAFHHQQSTLPRVLTGCAARNQLPFNISLFQEGIVWLRRGHKKFMHEQHSDSTWEAEFWRLTLLWPAQHGWHRDLHLPASAPRRLLQPLARPTVLMFSTSGHYSCPESEWSLAPGAEREPSLAAVLCSSGTSWSLCKKAGVLCLTRRLRQTYALHTHRGDLLYAWKP